MPHVQRLYYILYSAGMEREKTGIKVTRSNLNHGSNKSFDTFLTVILSLLLFWMELKIMSVVRVIKIK